MGFHCLDGSPSSPSPCGVEFLADDCSGLSSLILRLGVQLICAFIIDVILVLLQTPVLSFAFVLKSKIGRFPLLQLPRLEREISQSSDAQGAFRNRNNVPSSISIRSSVV